MLHENFGRAVGLAGTVVAGICAVLLASSGDLSWLEWA